MKKLRDKIFIWPSWIAKLVAGEEQCEWKYWLKAHYQTDKKPSGFNLASWTIQHNQLLRKRRDELEKLGYIVTIEDQNSFKYTPEGKDFVISGKIDIVAYKDNEAIVEDCKTGSCKTSDYVQVLFYMLMLPLVFPAHKDKIISGTIVYKDGVPNSPVPETVVNDKTLVDLIWTTIALIAGKEESCRRVPSVNECKKCDICAGDCKDRI